MSSRAEQVAEVLWELKRANKLGTCSLVAERAGFAAGANGRTLLACLKKVRAEWPHLQWWRVLEDSCKLKKGSEQERELVKNGFEMEPVPSQDKVVRPLAIEEHMIVWAEASV